MVRRFLYFFDAGNLSCARELAPLPSRSPLFATNFDGTACAAFCEEYSDAALASRSARAADAGLTRDRWVPTL